MSYRHRGSASDLLSHATERRLVVRRLRAAFAELDGELNGSSALRWIIGAPFAWLDRARSVLDCFAHVFGLAERAELDRVFKEYGRAFDAVAARHRKGQPDAAKAPSTPPINEIVEACGAAAASLCDTLSAADD